MVSCFTALRGRHFFSLLILPLFVAGCATFAPGPRDQEELPLPKAFSLYEEAAPSPDRWWEQFGSAELNGLVARALDGNIGIRRIQARLAQADAIARQSGAALYPDLTLTGEVSATRRQTDTGQSPDPIDTATAKLEALNRLIAGGGGSAPDPLTGALTDLETRIRALDALRAEPPSSRTTSTTHSYRFGLGSQYEIDLWGRVRAQREAALLDFEASREDLHAARLSLSGLVTRQWLSVVAASQQLGLVQRQLDLNRTTLGLIELRFRNGLATALDVLQQRQAVAQTEALVPPLESVLEVGRRELAALLGELPTTPPTVADDTLPDPGPLPDPGLPADLLAARPDVRAAGLALGSADWRVAVARADRLPALRLSASAGYGADSWDLVFSNWAATLAAGVTGPVFDGGRRKAEVDRSRAVATERLEAYRGLVLDAVTEVEGLMILESKQAEYLDALGVERDTARAVHEQALVRYLQGLSDYLPVLSSLQQLQVLERRLVQAGQARLEYRARLCVALGGAWMRDDPGGTDAGKDGVTS
jgi:outer membrane protein, multidrug efflux system